MHSSLAAAVILVITFGGAATAQSTDSSQPPNATPTLQIHIRDYADVPKWALSSAVAEATAIFKEAGVRLEWSVRRSSDLADPPSESLVPANIITVQVLASPRDARISQDPTKLGAVPGADRGGRIAYLFSSRIEIVAKRNSVGFGVLLGIVLAHEMGHVLLKGRPHTPSAIMRPFYATQQIHEILSRRQGFSAAEAEVIRNSCS